MSRDVHDWHLNLSSGYQESTLDDLEDSFPWATNPFLVPSALSAVADWMSLGCIVEAKNQSLFTPMGQRFEEIGCVRLGSSSSLLPRNRHAGRLPPTH